MHPPGPPVVGHIDQTVLQNGFATTRRARYRTHARHAENTQDINKSGNRERVVPGVLFNGEQIMTVGEVGRSGIGPISHTADLSIRRAWVALGEARADALRPATAVADDVAAFLAGDRALPAPVRNGIEALLKRQCLLEDELCRQRKLLQEWILSQLTYKALYYQYSGQAPDALRPELMLEKDMVRRRIRDELQAGGDYLSVLGLPSCSPSRP